MSGILDPIGAVCVARIGPKPVIESALARAGGVLLQTHKKRSLAQSCTAPQADLPSVCPGICHAQCRKYKFPHFSADSAIRTICSVRLRPLKRTRNGTMHLTQRRFTQSAKRPTAEGYTKGQAYRSSCRRCTGVTLAPNAKSCLVRRMPCIRSLLLTTLTRY